MKKEQLFKKVIAYFEKEMPIAETELHYSNSYELLVAVILSAQCTDKRVNMITPELFRRYPEPQSLADSSVDEIFSYIRSISYPNNKARHLQGMAKMLISEFGGEVPSSRKDLESLPGVGRKTANVIASVVFQQPAMAVDTHVFRVSARIGLTVGARNPKQTEEQLIRYIPESLIPKAHHWLILHGRYVCKARNPLCPSCGLKEWCAYYRKNQPLGNRNDV